MAETADTAKVNEANAFEAMTARQRDLSKANTVLTNSLLDGDDVECWEEALYGAGEVLDAAQRLHDTARDGLRAAEALQEAKEQADEEATKAS